MRVKEERERIQESMRKGKGNYRGREQSRGRKEKRI